MSGGFRVAQVVRSDAFAGVERYLATVSAELVDGYRTELRTVEAVSRALSEGRIRLFAERIEPARPTGRQLLHFEVLVRLQHDARLGKTH